MVEETPESRQNHREPYLTDNFSACFDLAILKSLKYLYNTLDVLLWLIINMSSVVAFDLRKDLNKVRMTT